MRFGFLVTSDDPYSWNPKQRVADHTERAIAARDHGFEYIAVSHRFSFGPASSDERGEVITTSRFQPLLLLAHIAAILGSDVKYTTEVLVSSSFHPVQLAEDIATLDALCDGGLSVGIGLGWHPNELEAFNVEKSTRVKRFEELVILTRQLLTSEAVTYEGEFFRIHDARLAARSMQKPCPPIWIGASVDAAVRRAPRLGDSWTISGHHDVNEIKSQMEIYHNELAKIDRPIPRERPILRMIYVAEDRKRAFEEAQPVYAEIYRRRGAAKWFLASDRKWEPSALDEMHFIVGDPNDCIEQIAHIRDTLDVNIMILALPMQEISQESRLRSLKLLGDKVLPHFL